MTIRTLSARGRTRIALAAVAAALFGGAAAAPAADRAARPVYFVGLDGADWQLLDQLMAAGSMPNLARLAAEGSSGVLRTEIPPMSPILWTTMMTGVSPLEHRILDFTRFSPVNGMREPIGSDERLAPAVWNIASWAGRKTGVFGLWATYPAEEIQGVMVSDRLSSFLGPRGSPPDGAVSPASRLAAANAFRDRIEGEIALEEMRRFLPGLSAAEFESARRESNPYAGPVPGLWRMLVETRLQDALFRDYVEKENPDVAILYLESTDVAGHLFAQYMAPRLASTTAADFERFQGVPAAFYRWIDELLGRYAELARKRGATLFLASDHGFHWGEGRPARATSFSMSTAMTWHRQDGIYLLHGPGIPAKPRESAPQGLRRVAATILALADLAPGVSITGPPLPPVAASTAAPVDYSRRFRGEIRSRRPAAAAAPAAGSAEELAKLRSLGYLGESEVDSNRSSGSRDTRSPGSYNSEGVILLEARRPVEARTAFERALAIDPKFANAEGNLSELLFRAGEYERADALLLSGIEHGLPHGPSLRARRSNERLKLGRSYLESGACRSALPHLEAAEKLAPQNPTTPGAVGLAHRCLGDPTKALAAFKRSLALDPNQPALAAEVARLGG